VEAFLYNLPQYREKLSAYSRAGNQALLEKVDALIAEYTGGRSARAGR
jgi:hypothetical protein